MTPLTYAIALTGGISSGKSSVCSLLRLHGFHIIDADAIAHRILETLHQPLQKHFGVDVIEKGCVNRKRLGTIVFGDPEARKVLEALTHPLIYGTILEECQSREIFGKPYIVDIPLFFEVAEYPIDRSVLVYTPRTIQIKRLIERDGLNEDQAFARLSAQLDIEEKKGKATYLIDNSQDLRHLQREVDTFITTIKESYGC